MESSIPYPCPFAGQKRAVDLINLLLWIGLFLLLNEKVRFPNLSFPVMLVMLVKLSPWISTDLLDPSWVIQRFGLHACIQAMHTRKIVSLAWQGFMPWIKNSIKEKNCLFQCPFRCLTLPWIVGEMPWKSSRYHNDFSLFFADSRLKRTKQPFPAVFVWFL